MEFILIRSMENPRNSQNLDRAKISCHTANVDLVTLPVIAEEVNIDIYNVICVQNSGCQSITDLYGDRCHERHLQCSF